VAALRGDRQTAGTIAAQGIRSAERIVGAPRVLMLALALAGQVAILSGDDSAAAPLLRLLRLLRDKGVSYWADEALAVAALVLADRLPEEAAVVLTSSQALRGALDGTGGQLGALRGRLRQCRTQLIETLGPGRWQQAELKTLDMPVDEAIIRALTALETLSCHDG
jgi:hypothetical protein